MQTGAGILGPPSAACLAPGAMEPSTPVLLATVPGVHGTPRHVSGDIDTHSHLTRAFQNSDWIILVMVSVTRLPGWIAVQPVTPGSTLIMLSLRFIV